MGREVVEMRMGNKRARGRKVRVEPPVGLRQIKAARTKLNVPSHQGRKTQGTRPRVGRKPKLGKSQELRVPMQKGCPTPLGRYIAGDAFAG